MNEPSFYDVPRLLALRTIVQELDPDGPPRARFILDCAAQPTGNLALLPGSFNPPTNAHIALAGAMLETGQVDRVDFLLATRTVDKERIEGASLPDRVVVLEALANSSIGIGIVLVNRGLYVDQAVLLRAAAPSVVDLWFAVGFDKIVQIFDPRYYVDRDAALDRLFSLARFFVAPRGGAEFDDLEALLSRPENRRYADRVSRLNLPASYRQVSSSRLRAHDPEAMGDVPPVVVQFMSETGAYDAVKAGFDRESDDRYLARQRVLDLAGAGRLALTSPTDFRAAVERFRHADLLSNGSFMIGTARENSAPRSSRSDPS